MRRRLAALAAAALLAPLLAHAAPAPREGDPDQEAGLPGVCQRAHVTCGSLRRPIDPKGRAPGTIDIAYAVYRHWRSGPAAGTIVAQEGGPGLSSLRSFSSYHALYEPLLGDHDLIVVDARGTGNSGAIDCAPMQRAWKITIDNAGQCGASLGAAADYYGTGLAVEDMIAVLDRLGVTTFDYYGDSYGTFFGQVLAARYPDRLRSVVLDGAYPVIGESPWYPHAGEAMRRGVNLACRRSTYCAALPGSSLERVTALAQSVRAKPVTGQAPDANGLTRTVTADPTSLGLTLYIGLSGWPTFKDLDAAARAHARGDDKPLLRLIAENETGELGPGGAAKAYSRGLFTANVCQDDQTVYEMNASFAERLAARDEAVADKAAENPGLYRPLTIDEFLRVPIDISYVNLCLRWPTDGPPYPPGQPIPREARFTKAPVLVINGELDMLTPVADGAVVAAQFPHGLQVVMANSFHVDALGDVDDCAASIVRRFTATLTTGDTACAPRIKAVRLTPFFPLKAEQALPAAPMSGNAADRRERALASAALQTAADAIARWYVNYSGTDQGLRGGTWKWTQDGAIVRFTFLATRWAPDLAVSGAASWNQGNGAIAANLTFAADDGAAGQLAARWNDRDDARAATITGAVDGRALRAMMAPP